MLDTCLNAKFAGLDSLTGLYLIADATRAAHVPGAPGSFGSGFLSDPSQVFAKLRAADVNMVETSVVVQASQLQQRKVESPRATLRPLSDTTCNGIATPLPCQPLAPLPVGCTPLGSMQVRAMETDATSDGSPSRKAQKRGLISLANYTTAPSSAAAQDEPREEAIKTMLLYQHVRC